MTIVNAISNDVINAKFVYFVHKFTDSLTTHTNMQAVHVHSIGGYITAKYAPTTKVRKNYSG